jgi:HK97 family phage prohead protease
MRAADYEDEYEFVSACIYDAMLAGADIGEATALCVAQWDEAQDERTKKYEIDRKGFERRAARLEVRARGRRLEGYAATFGTEARISDFTEIIAPGAFAKSLSDDVLALVDHDPARLLARTRSKTLRLSEDSKGLAFDLDLPATSVGNDVLALAERGDLGGMSFGFTIARDGETWDGTRRTLRAVDLREISVVSAWPAYADTVVNARSKKISELKSFPRLTLARRWLETL